MIYGLDYGNFHPGCDVELLQTAKGLLLHCKTCRVLGDAIDQGKRISNADSSKVGKNVERPEFHYTTSIPVSF